MYYLNNNYKGTCIIMKLFIDDFLNFKKLTKFIGLNKNFIIQGHNLKIMLKARKKIKKILYL